MLFVLSGAVNDITARLFIPIGAEQYALCEPVIEKMPGWTESTAGIRSFDALPGNAKAYIKRIEELIGVKVDIVSTGPERDETIILKHPFDV